MLDHHLCWRLLRRLHCLVRLQIRSKVLDGHSVQDSFGPFSGIVLGFVKGTLTGRPKSPFSLPYHALTIVVLQNLVSETPLSCHAASQLSRSCRTLPEALIQLVILEPSQNT